MGWDTGGRPATRRPGTWQRSAARKFPAWYTQPGTVLGYLEQHPELKAAENREDMFDYRDASEDVDTYDDDEDEY